MDQLSIKILPYVFLGGGIGATLRWGLSLFWFQLTQRPWAGTVFVNLFGCLIYFLAVRFLPAEDKVVTFMLQIGILGSLTTFSTFSYEVAILIRNQQLSEAVLVIGLNVLVGIIIGVGILR